MKSCCLWSQTSGGVRSFGRALPSDLGIPRRGRGAERRGAPLRDRAHGLERSVAGESSSGWVRRLIRLCGPAVPTLRFVIVDVFTDRAFAGNQLAVFTDGREVDSETMQTLAFEIGFSETTFVLPAEASGTARIRIFHSLRELPFAGHPILGTAWVLGTPRQRTVVELETGSGIVPSSSSGTSPARSSTGEWCSRSRASSCFPVGKRCSLRLASLALRSRSSATTTVLSISSSCSTRMRTVARLRPDFAALADFEANLALHRRFGHIVEVAHVRAGVVVPEDPATGSC